MSVLFLNLLISSGRGPLRRRKPGELYRTLSISLVSIKTTMTAGCYSLPSILTICTSLSVSEASSEVGVRHEAGRPYSDKLRRASPNGRAHQDGRSECAYITAAIRRQLFVGGAGRGSAVNGGARTSSFETTTRWSACKSNLSAGDGA